MQSELASLVPFQIVGSPLLLVVQMTWSALISAHGDCGRWEQAVGALRRMQSLGFQPHTSAYGPAISACSRARRPSPSLLQSLFQEMVDAGCTPTVATFGALIKGFGKSEEVALAEEAFQNMLQRGIK